MACNLDLRDYEKYQSNEYDSVTKYIQWTIELIEGTQLQCNVAN